MTNNEAIGILGLVVETAKGRCFVTDEAISDAYEMAINALTLQTTLKERCLTCEHCERCDSELANDSPELDNKFGDLIRRQEAINAVQHAFDKETILNSFVRKVAIDALKVMPSAQPEIKPIEYRDCANAMLRMWMDKVVTDGEYNSIMDKLNSYWRRTDG